MITRVRSVVLAAGSVAVLSIACSDGFIESDPYGGAAIVQPDSPGAAGTLAIGGATVMGGASSGVSSAPNAGQSSSGGAGSIGAGGMLGAAAAGSAGQPMTTPQGGSIGQGGGAQAGSGGSGSTAGAAGSSSQSGSASGGTAGSSAMPACDDAEDIRCNDSCVDPNTSEQHCGSCGKACLSGQECSDGMCECTGERTLCGSTCVDTDTDEQNCGDCGDKCATGAMCSGGKCTGGEPGPVTSCASISDFGVVSSTIVVKNGQTYDGQCRRYRAHPDELGDGSQDEGQQPVFLLENGARLINVVLGAPAADGIHTEGNVTLENITWEDIGEDALTIKESGTVILNGGSAKNGADKVFQINAASTFRLSNFKASNAGKLIRQNGGSGFKAAVFIDKCDVANMSESIFRTDSSSSTVSMTNTRYHAIGDSLFIGVASGNISQSNNTQY